MTDLDDFYYFNTEVVQGFALTSVLMLLLVPSPQPPLPFCPVPSAFPIAQVESSDITMHQAWTRPDRGMIPEAHIWLLRQMHT